MKSFPIYLKVHGGVTDVFTDRLRSCIAIIVVTILLGTLLSLLVSSLSTLRYNNALSATDKSKSAPVVPYSIPFLYHTIPMARSPFECITQILTRYDWRSPLQMRAGLLDFTVVSNPAHISTVFRSSKQLSNKQSILFALKNLLKAPPHAVSFYANDTSGIGTTPRKGSSVEPENRIYFHQAGAVQKYLSSQHLTFLSTKYLELLEHNLHSMPMGHTTDWVGFPDLYQFVQQTATRASVETLMGSKLFEINPNIIDELWAYENAVPTLVRCMPRWLAPAEHRARDRLHASVKRWHAVALANSDISKIEKGDPEWEPYFGSKLLKARQLYWSKMKPMDADARASEDLGLMMASNGNGVPSLFWYLYETLRDEDLRQRMSSEVALCVENGRLDFEKLSSQPLLQSAYAEVLRIRVAIAMTRVDEFKDFNLDGYQIKRNHPMIIFSRPPALNAEAWTQAGRPPAETAPLEEFYAERFLVTKDDAASAEAPPSSASGGASVKFSLDGLAGLWIPYGGGQRMCPGRHLAKREIIGTLALLFTQFELELLDAKVARVEPDMGRYPAGALPPMQKVPFRIRRRSAKEQDAA